MKKKILDFVFCGVFMTSLIANSEDAVGVIKKHSAFAEIDLAKLAEGEVMVQRGNLMNFIRGISGETCYVVKKSLPVTLRAIQFSDFANQNNPSVVLHKEFQGSLGEHLLTESAFGTDKFTVRRFVEKTLEIQNDPKDFHLSKSEAGKMMKILNDSKGLKSQAEIARKAWYAVLKERNIRFLAGGLSGLIPYEIGSKTVDLATDIRSLLAETPKVLSRFGELLSEAGLKSAGAFKPESVVNQYCEILNWDIVAMVDLGAIFAKKFSDGHVQLIDYQYFASGIYYQSMTLFELWSVEVNKQSYTLVWRIDELATPSLEVIRGVERLAYSKLMMSEIKKSIVDFQKETLRKAER